MLSGAEAAAVAVKPVSVAELIFMSPLAVLTCALLPIVTSESLAVFVTAMPTTSAEVAAPVPASLFTAVDAVLLTSVTAEEVIAIVFAGVASVLAAPFAVTLPLTVTEALFVVSA